MNYSLTFVATVYNEEKNIKGFLDSVFAQTRLPDEVIIIDGGSIDKTPELIQEYIRKSRQKLLFDIKPGNRSVGRNEAIKRATGDIIVCSDAGNVLDSHWIEEITKPFQDKTVQVVAGYYRGKVGTTFQKCVIPYFLVMPDKVNEKNFLPATRSMAFRKTIWEKVGKFPEQYSDNEDYVFAKRLKKNNISAAFAKQAIVEWIPPSSIRSFFKTVFRFAKGDAQAGIIRPKVVLIFVRYIFIIQVINLAFRYKFPFLFLFLLYSGILYVAWSIKKNYKYVYDAKAFIILPLLQFTSDFAVLLGTFIGFIKSLWVIQDKQ